MTTTKNYLSDEYKTVTCYNCQEKFFLIALAVKSLNFCSTCWGSKVKDGK